VVLDNTSESFIVYITRNARSHARKFLRLQSFHLFLYFYSIVAIVITTRDTRFSLTFWYLRVFHKLVA
jgi:hypothetical protein